MKREKNPTICGGHEDRFRSIERKIWILENPQKFKMLEEVRWDLAKDYMSDQSRSIASPLAPVTIIGVEISPPDYHHPYRRKYTVIFSEDWMEGFYMAGEELLASESMLQSVGSK